MLKGRKYVKKYKSNDASELYIMSIHCIYIEEVASLSIISVNISECLNKDNYIRTIQN
jgi:hypothetical protein